MRFWGQMLLVFCLLYCALSRVAIVHETCDILLRHVFNINFFELQLHKHPSEDSIAGLRVAVLCAFLTYIYSIYFPPRDSDSDKERRSKITLGYSTILKAIRSLNWMVSLQFNDMNDRLLSLENNSEIYWKKYCKSLSKKADLSDARKVASKMPRKHLHVITRNAASRRMRNLKIRLDAAQLEKLQLAVQNNDLSLSVTALDDVIEALFSDLTQSSPNSTHLTNIDKLKHVHKSAKTINKQKDARISALKAENNNLSENLYDVKQDLDSARTKAADSADDFQRLEGRLQQVTEAKSEIEESLRKCKNTIRQLDINHNYCIRRVANLETQLDRARQSTRDADERGDKINDELQDTNRQLRDLERERAKLETQGDRLQAELKVTQDKLSDGDISIEQKQAGLQSKYASDLKEKTQDLKAANEYLRQLETQISDIKQLHANELADKENKVSCLKDQHANVISSKDKDLEEAQDLNRTAISRKNQEMRDHHTDTQVILSRKDKEIEDLRTQHTAAITAKDAKLEDLLNQRVTAITLKDKELDAITSRHDDQVKQLQEQLASVSQQKNDKAKKLEALRKEHAAIIARKDAELEDTRTIHAIAISGKESEIGTLHGKHTAAIASKDAELEETRANHTIAISSKDSEIVKMHTEHTAAIAGKDEEIEALRKNTDMAKLHEQQSSVIAQKDSELADLREKLTSGTKQKDDELKSLEASLSEHVATIASKDTEMVKVCEKHSATMAQKDVELQASRDELASVTAQKDDEIKDLRETLAAATKQDQGMSTGSSSQVPDVEKKDEQQVTPLALRPTASASEAAKKARADSLQILADRQEATIVDMKAEWRKVHNIIEDIMMDLPTVLRKFGKTPYTCRMEIAAKIAKDSELRIPAHMNELETAMLMRRGGYELQLTVEHQLAFLKNFASAVLKAHPEVEGIAKSVAATFVPPAPQVDKPVKAPTKAATTASSSVATPRQTPPKALCACEYHFLVTDSQADCKDHLDGCDEFAQATAEEKTRLLGKLGMAADVQKKQTQPKSETITCWNCKRDFPKAVSQWFYGVHTKTCKRNAPSFTDLPGSGPSAAKTPVRQQSQIVQVPRLATPEKTAIEPPASPAITTPSPLAIVNENNWQKKDASDNGGAPEPKAWGLGKSRHAH